MADYKKYNLNEESAGYQTTDNMREKLRHYMSTS